MKPGVYEEIAKAILEDGADVQGAKIRTCRKYSLENVPSNSDILNNLSPKKRELLLNRLKKKPIRTLSGVAVVAVMTSPAPCPHGRCLYCPQGKEAPQSYTGFEPAALRGIRSEFDPFTQVNERLKQLETIGHNIEKAELIIMGGTFPSRERDYQVWFVKRCFDAMNSFGNPFELASETLEEAKQLNERAMVRNVGVTFETRPDFAGEEPVNDMLGLGATRIEMGVQTLRDEVYQKMNRRHALKDVIASTRIVKDSGLKLCYHMMPGLFSSFSEDIEMFDRLFSSPDFKPDMIKIYPTLVLKGTGLYDMWKDGEYISPSEEEVIDLIVKIKKSLPKWVRTMRIQRDIPAGLIVAGVKRGNLGELVQERLDEGGIRCRCIRCRDAGHLNYKKGITISNLEVLEECYEASEGLEHFISIEDTHSDVIAGYIRMRFPSPKAHRKEFNSDTAVIRELKVVGPALKLGEKGTFGRQHGGIGRSLLEKAEAIAETSGFGKLLVTSAVGTREYYRKMDYQRIGPYMGKTL
jgi:elongator complex protein 3